MASKSDLEFKMVELYKQAADDYGHAVYFQEWRGVSEDGKFWGGKIHIPNLAIVESIREKYGIDFTADEIEYGGQVFYGFPLELPEVIWSKAAERVAQAERMYLALQRWILPETAFPASQGGFQPGRTDPELRSSAVVLGQPENP